MTQMIERDDVIVKKMTDLIIKYQSQKVGQEVFVMDLLAGAHFRRAKLNELVLPPFRHLHHTSLVPTSVAIVRRRPHRH
jgi:hypothetical protein